MTNQLIHFFKREEVILFFFFLLIYLLTPRFLATSDGLPNRLLPISLVSEGDLYLDEYFLAGDAQVPYSIRQVNEHFVSIYPPGTGVIVSPLYVLPAVFDLLDSKQAISNMARISAGILAAAAVSLLYLVLRRQVSEKWAIILAFLYALGTCQWTISSQDLWKNSATSFLLCLALFLLLRHLNCARDFIVLGFVAGLLVTVRQLSIVFVLLFGAYILHRYRKNILHFVLGLVPPALLLALYNKVYIGSFLDVGYGRSAVKTIFENEIGFYPGSFIETLSGLFISPARGMFIYSPILLFSLLGLILLFKKKVLPKKSNLRLLLIYSVPFILLFTVTTAKWKFWWGGSVYGYRMVVDLVPLFILLMAPVVKSGLLNKRIIRYLFFVLFAFSIFVQFTGIVFWDESWFYQHDLKNAEDMQAMWQWDDNPIIHYSKMYLLN